MSANDPRREIRVDGSAGAVVGDHNFVYHSLAGLLPPHQVYAPATLCNLPAPSPLFKGRDLGVVHDLFVAGWNTRAVIHGSAGIGKTQLAVQYATATDDVFRWWIDASNPESINAGLIALTSALHPAVAVHGQTHAVDWAAGWLRAHMGWLVVLDGVTDLDHVRSLLDHSHPQGRILATTRLDPGPSAFAERGLRPLHLTGLPRESSITMLTSLTGIRDEDDLNTLALHLGDHPLALREAGAILANQPDMACYDFSEFAADFIFSSDTPAMNDAGRTIRTLYRADLDAVTAESPEAIRLLGLLCVFGRGPLPDIVIGHLTGDRASAAARQHLSLLSARGLVHRAQRHVIVPGLLQTVVRQQLGDGLGQALLSAVHALAASLPPRPLVSNEPTTFRSGQVNARTIWAALGTHVLYTSGQVLMRLNSPRRGFLRTAGLEAVMKLMDRAAAIAYLAGNYRDAMILASWLLEDKRPESRAGRAVVLVLRFAESPPGHVPGEPEARVYRFAMELVARAALSAEEQRAITNRVNGDVLFGLRQLAQMASRTLGEGHRFVIAVEIAYAFATAVIHLRELQGMPLVGSVAARTPWLNHPDTPPADLRESSVLHLYAVLEHAVESSSAYLGPDDVLTLNARWLEEVLVLTDQTRPDDSDADLGLLQVWALFLPLVAEASELLRRH